MPDEAAEFRTGATPPEIRAMGNCWPVLVYGRRFVKATGIGEMPARVNGMSRSDYLLRHGYELAWMTGRFEGVKQFEDTMRVWRRWAIGILIFELVGLTAGIVEAAVWYAHNWGHWR